MILKLEEKHSNFIYALSIKYDEELRKIRDRRDHWKNTTRDRLHKIIEYIKDTAKLPEIRTQKVLGCENLEAVNIGINQTSSGIVSIEGS